jgi:hypothetical protein
LIKLQILIERFEDKKRQQVAGYTSFGFQSKLQVQSSLARAVTVDNEVTTKTCTLHTLNVIDKRKECSEITQWIIKMKLALKLLRK